MLQPYFISMQCVQDCQVNVLVLNMNLINTIYSRTYLMLKRKARFKMTYFTKKGIMKGITNLV